MSELRDQQIDARTAALIVTAMDTRPLLPSTIRTWRSRGRLRSVGCDARGHRTYRLGDVIDLAHARHASVPPATSGGV